MLLQQALHRRACRHCRLVFVCGVWKRYRGLLVEWMGNVWRSGGHGPLPGSGNLRRSGVSSGAAAATAWSIFRSIE